MPRFLLVLLLSLPLPLFAQADWPEFRGPTGQGLAGDVKLPTEWGPDKNVAWKVPVPGKGWSSPVVAAGRVYLTTAAPLGDGPSADQSLRALCLDAATGKTLWDVEVFRQDGKTSPKPHSKNGHASATPCVDGDRVYAHFGHQGTACLNTADGSTTWANRDLTYKPVHGNGGSPVVYHDTLFVNIDGLDRRELVAFDKLTGKVKWEAKRAQPAKKAFSFCTPLVAPVAGQVTVISVGSDVVNGFDPDTGKELWHLTYDGYSIIPRPVVANGLIYMSTSYDTASLLAVRVERTGAGRTASVAWKAAKGAPHSASMVAVGDELYAVSDNGLATCFDAKTGKIHWQERVPGGYSSSLLAAGGLLYLQNESGVGTVLKLGTTFEVVATNDLRERSLASYAVDGDALLIRTEKHLYRIGK